MEGNITATVYSLVLSENNSSEIVVTVETNSKESPDTLTNLLIWPLEQRLQEFSNIDEQFMFRIKMTERHGMFRISAYIMPLQCRSEGFVYILNGCLCNCPCAVPFYTSLIKMAVLNFLTQAVVMLLP